MRMSSLSIVLQSIGLLLIINYSGRSNETTDNHWRLSSRPESPSSDARPYHRVSNQKAVSWLGLQRQLSAIACCVIVRALVHLSLKMTDFRERYKRLGFNSEANRALRSQRHGEARRGLRDEQMSLRREMGTNNGDDSYSLDDDVSANTQESCFSGYSQDSASCKGADSREDAKTKAAAEHEAAVKQRWERLQKWREEKNKRKLIERKKAKPVFKVGVVHHRVYSPPVNKEPAPLPPSKLCRSLSANVSQTAPKRVTRATEKRLAVKTLVNQQKRENIRSKKKTQPQVHNPMNEDRHVQLAPKDHIFKAPVGVTPMPIFGRQALEATKENILAEISTFYIPTTTGTDAFSESFNESSVSLKLASDDQEVLNESATNEAHSPVSRHSLKNLSPPVADEVIVNGVTPRDQEMMEVEQFSKTEKRNVSFSAPDKTESPVSSRKSQKVLASPVKVASAKEIAIDSPRHTRSTRAANKRRRIEWTDSADSGIEPSLTPDEPSVSTRRSMKVTVSASVEFQTDSISTPDEKEKPLSSRRRSSSKVPSDSSENESAPTPSSEPINKRRSTKLIASGSTDSEEIFVKPAASRWRSTKIISETVTLNSSKVVTTADVHQSPLANQEPDVLIKSPPRRKSTRFTTNNQENVDFNSTNLMDFTFSAPVKPPKILDAPKSLLDDSVANLTPRRSTRLPTTASTSNPEEDQPLIRFSSFYVPTPTMNESSSSEPTKQHSPNDVMNLSLNISLPKESEEEKPPAFFSPYIVQSRGKNSARKEIKKRTFSQLGSQKEDTPTKDNIMQKLNISVDEEERTAQYYKLILNREIERLNELCERWNMVKENPETPEESRYIIQAACGQTQLLINKKFERFRGLVQDCETGRGEMLVTCKDLQGFWDMMYMEINDCESRFNKLEEMKANNWVTKEDEDAIKEVEKKKKKVPVKKPATKKPVTAKSSSLRAMIAAARKKKAQADGGVEASEETSTESVENLIEERNDNKKLASSSKTPTSASKYNSNLLKKVQLSQTRKASASPLVVMKLGQMIKTPEVQLDDSIVYINSGRTPAKSILKKDEGMGSVSKSTHKVFFREQSNEIKEFENRNSFIDMSLDCIEEMKEPIERKLNFEDESFVENGEEEKSRKVMTLTASPMISISPLSLKDRKTESSITKNKSTKLKKQISFKENDDESQPKSLRIKKFSAPLTPIPKRRNEKNIEGDISIEVNDAAHESNHDTPRPQLVKEIYLNEQGLVCQRFVPSKKGTPGRSNLKRSNSEATRTSRKNSKIQGSDELKNTPATPRLRRRTANVPEIQISTPRTVLQELSAESKSSTLRFKKQSFERSFADTTLTHDNVDVSMEEIVTPKTSETKSELKESSTQSPSLKRTRAFKVANNEETSVKRTASPKLRRTKSLNKKKVDVDENPKETLRIKGVTTLQENIEPNEQETDQSTKRKLPKTPSFMRKISKKQLEIIDQSEKLTDVSNPVNDAMTPNTRRKSLRITRASVRDEN